MADQTFKNTDRSGAQSTSGSAPHGFEKAASTPKGVGDQVKNVADQALSAGRDLKEKAIDVTGSSAEALKGHASDLMDSAKDMASQTTDKLKRTVDGQKIAGAEYVGSLANTMRRAAAREILLHVAHQRIAIAEDQRQQSGMIVRITLRESAG